MIRLTTLRDHFRAMSEAQHLPDCPTLTAKEPYWPAWSIYYADDGLPQGMRWNGPKPEWEPPKCDGCVSEEDRQWFARLASEVDTYVGTQGTLL